MFQGRFRRWPDVCLFVFNLSLVGLPGILATES